MSAPKASLSVQATPVWFEAHLARKPHARVATPTERERELAEVANSYLTRRELFASYGTDEDCLDVVRAELLARGVAEPDALLEGVARKVYRTSRTGAPVAQARAFIARAVEQKNLVLDAALIRRIGIEQQPSAVR